MRAAVISALVALAAVAAPTAAHAECDSWLWCPSPAEQAVAITVSVVIVGAGVGSLAYNSYHAAHETRAWMPARVTGVVFGFAEFLGGTLAIVAGEHDAIDITAGAALMGLGIASVWAGVLARPATRADTIPYAAVGGGMTTVGFVTRF